MIKSIITIFFAFLTALTFAQNTDCKTADDSILVRKERGEIAYFYPTKYQPDQYFYIVFKDGKYHKKQIPMGSISNDFLRCYNKGSQPLLDSVFNIDFFRKTDSILGVYDRSGNGYRNTDFPGGAYALQKFLSKNMSLPVGAKPIDADPYIRVYYSFLVGETGEISDINLVKSNCKECEAPILEAIKKMPKFIPATEAGQPKKLKYIMPFSKKI